MAYSTETNLIIQSALSAAFLMDLSNNSNTFVSSDFFRDMKVVFPEVKKYYQDGKTGIGNQGALLMCMYSLLVIPKELLGSKYKNNYVGIDKYIDSKKVKLIDTYLSTGKTPEYVRHMRNAVAHANVCFNDTDPSNILVAFKDRKNRKSKFEVTFSVKDIPEILIKMLDVIHTRYIVGVKQYECDK